MIRVMLLTGRLVAVAVSRLVRLFGEFNFPIGYGTNPISQIVVRAFASYADPFAPEVEHPLSLGGWSGIVGQFPFAAGRPQTCGVSQWKIPGGESSILPYLDARNQTWRRMLKLR